MKASLTGCKIGPANRMTLLRALRYGCLALLALLFTLPVQADDYTYTTNNGAITITGYTGPGGALAIPDTINGYPVTSIGNSPCLSVSVPPLRHPADRQEKFPERLGPTADSG